MEKQKGSKKWLERVYRLFVESDKLTDTNDGSLDFVYHSTVKKVTEDYENLGFNTAISQMMIFINEAYKAKAVEVMQKVSLRCFHVLHFISVKKCGKTWS